MLCFAYGSNLDQIQMRQRCPGAELVDAAWLPGHRLAFVGYSGRWGGAVATVVRLPGAFVEGLVYRLTPEDVERLDRFEGCPSSYRRVRREVLTHEGQWVRPTLYLHAGGRPGQPSASYVDVIRRAYSRHGFDSTPIDRVAGGRP